MEVQGGGPSYNSNGATVGAYGGGAGCNYNASNTKTGSNGAIANEGGNASNTGSFTACGGGGGGSIKGNGSDGRNSSVNTDWRRCDGGLGAPPILANDSLLSAYPFKSVTGGAWAEGGNGSCGFAAIGGGSLLVPGVISSYGLSGRLSRVNRNVTDDGM